MVSARAFGAVHRRVLERRPEIEADLQARLRKVFGRQGRRVEKRLHVIRKGLTVDVPMTADGPEPRVPKSTPVPSLRASEVFMADFDDDLAGELRPAFESHTAAIGGALIGAALFGSVKGGLNVRSSTQIDRQVGRLKYVSDATLMSVEDALGAAYQAGTTFEQLGTQIGGVFDRLGVRAVGQIARIEAGTLLSGAASSAALTVDLDGMKVWETMQDDRVRDTHEDAQGQEVPVADQFEVGGVPMEYPGDPSAPIDLWANCRCFVRFTSPEGSPDEEVDAGGFEDTGDF